MPTPEPSARHMIKQFEATESRCSYPNKGGDFQAFVFHAVVDLGKPRVHRHDSRYGWFLHRVLNQPFHLMPCWHNFLASRERRRNGVRNSIKEWCDNFRLHKHNVSQRSANTSNFPICETCLHKRISNWTLRCCSVLFRTDSDGSSEDFF